MVTFDKPLSENSIARGGVGGGLIVIRYSNTCLKSFRTPILNSEGKKRVKCLFLYLKLNTTLQMATIHSNIICLDFPVIECEHTNRLFISVQFRSFLRLRYFESSENCQKIVRKFA